MRSSSWKSRTQTEDRETEGQRDRETERLGDRIPLSLRLSVSLSLCPSVSPSPWQVFLTDIRQPVSRLAAHVIDQAIGLARISALVEHIVRLAPRDLQNLLVAHDVGDAERGDARLAGAHHLARASNLQILLGDFEAVRGLFHYLHPPAQLMQLRQAEALGVFDQHDRGVRHVHADLDHGRSHQNLNLIRAERPHYALFLGGLHLSVQQADVEFREDLLAEVLVHLGRVPQIELFGLLDDRINDVSLAALFDLVADELVNLLAPVFAAHVRRNRRAARRHLVDDRDFEVAVNGHRQAARDRRSRHYQDVWVDAAPSNFGALQHAEAMLFVDHGEAQAFELHRVLN